MRLIDTDKLILNLNDYEIYDEKCIVDNLSQFGEPLNCTGHQFDSPCKDCCSFEGCKNFYLEKLAPLMRQPIVYGLGVLKYHTLRKNNDSLPGKSPLDITRYFGDRGPANKCH